MKTLAQTGRQHPTPPLAAPRRGRVGEQPIPWASQASRTNNATISRRCDRVPAADENNKPGSHRVGRADRIQIQFPHVCGAEMTRGHRAHSTQRSGAAPWRWVADRWRLEAPLSCALLPLESHRHQQNKSQGGHHIGRRLGNQVRAVEKVETRATSEEARRSVADEC